MALLLVPTKERVYLPIIADSRQLEPVLDGLGSWELGSDGSLERSFEAPPTAEEMQLYAGQVVDLLTGLADYLMIPLINPLPVFTDAIQAGDDPFLSFDTHWSSHGHALVAAEVANTLQAWTCPR